MDSVTKRRREMCVTKEGTIGQRRKNKQLCERERRSNLCRKGGIRNRVKEEIIR